jgi:hypothetical protein
MHPTIPTSVNGLDQIHVAFCYGQYYLGWNHWNLNEDTGFPVQESNPELFEHQARLQANTSVFSPDLVNKVLRLKEKLKLLPVCKHHTMKEHAAGIAQSVKRLRSQGSIPGGGKRFVSSTQRPDRL